MHVTTNEFREEVRVLITSKDMSEIRIPVSGRYIGGLHLHDVSASGNNSE